MRECPGIQDVIIFGKDIGGRMMAVMHTIQLPILFDLAEENNISLW